LYTKGFNWNNKNDSSLLAGQVSFTNTNFLIGGRIANILQPSVEIGTSEKIASVQEREFITRRTNAGAGSPTDLRNYQLRFATADRKTLTISMIEAMRGDPQLAFERVARQAGVETEKVRAKVVVLANGIPLDPKAIKRHNLHLEAVAKGDYSVPNNFPNIIKKHENDVIKQIDTDLIGYYHIQKSSNGHNTIYMNELMASMLAIDMDGDELIAHIQRKRDGDGNIMWESMFPNKHPYNQQMPIFRNVNYEKDFDFDPNRLFLGEFSGINNKQKGFEAYTGDLMDPGSVVFAGETSSRKYSVFGDLFRARKSSETTLEQQAIKLANTQLTDAKTGQITNIQDMKNMYASLAELNSEKLNEPEKYAERLMATQRALEAHMETFSGGNIREKARVMGTKVYNLRGRHLDDFVEHFGNFVDQSFGEPNLVLERIAQIHHINEGFLDPSRTGERTAAIEIGMKQSRGRNIEQDVNVLDAFQYHLNNSLFTLNTNRITNLSGKENIELLRNYILNESNPVDFLKEAFSIHNESDFQPFARKIFKRKITETPIKQFGNNTILHRMQNMGLLLLHDIDNPGILERSDITDRNYSTPKAFIFKDFDQRFLTPNSLSNADEYGKDVLTPIIGNIVDKDSNFLDIFDYVANSVEEQFEGEDLFSISGDFEYENLIQTLETGARGKKVGLRGEIEVAMDTSSSRILSELKRAGAGSTYHKKIAYQHTLTHKSNAVQRIIDSVSDVASNLGFKGNSVVTINQQTGEIVIPQSELIVSSGSVGMDLMAKNLELEDKTTAFSGFVRKVGGVLKKQTGNTDKKDRFLNFTMGEEKNSFIPIGLQKNLHWGNDTNMARRSSDIRRQLGGGGIMLGNVNIAFGDSSVAEEIFKMYNLEAELGAKRVNEGLFIASRAFQTRMLESVFGAAQFGPNLKEHEYNIQKEKFVNRMLLQDESSHFDVTEMGLDTRSRLKQEYEHMFASMYTENRDVKGGRVEYNLNKEGYNNMTSRVLKLASLTGDKATIVTVDSLGEGPNGPIELLGTLDARRARGAAVATYQMNVQDAVKQGRLAHSEIAKVVDKAGDLLPLGLNNEEMEQITAGIQKNMHEVTITNNGLTSKFMGGISHNEGHWFVTATHADRIETESVNTAYRGLTKLKLAGSLAKLADSEFGNTVVGAGIQVTLGVIADHFGSMARAVGDSSGSTQLTQRELLEAGRKFAASNYINEAEELGYTQNKNIGSRVPTTKGPLATLENLKTGADSAARLSAASTSTITAGYGAVVMGAAAVLAVKPNGVMVGSGRDHDRNTHNVQNSKMNKMIAKVQGMSSVDGGVYNY
jgi:hypothetical protein